MEEASKSYSTDAASTICPGMFAKSSGICHTNPEIILQEFTHS